WSSLISLLKKSLSAFIDKKEWGVLLEYSIPRRAKRIDSVLIADNLIFVVEYKDGETEYSNNYIIQLEDYCLDLRDFHFESKDRTIIPVLLCPDAPMYNNEFSASDDYVQKTLFANRDTLQEIMSQSIQYWGNSAN